MLFETLNKKVHKYPTQWTEKRTTMTFVNLNIRIFLQKKLEVLFQGMKSYIPQLDIPMQSFDDCNKIYFV